MKLPFSDSRRDASPMRNRGFTLPEVLIAMTVFTLLIGGVVFAHLFGLRMFQITETKLNATAGARKTLGRITEEIRTCKSTSVGNIKNGFFEGLLDGETQKGSALQIFPTANTNNFIVYYVYPSDQTFRRATNDAAFATVLAESITNSVVFSAQDLWGKVLTNNQANPVIHLSLEFYQPKRFVRVADHYKLETSVMRRARAPLE